MKKFVSIILILAMVFALCACQSQSEETPRPVLDFSNEETLEIIDSSDPIYEAVADMVPGVLKFVEYNHILNNSVDYSNVNSEDFWNIVAIATGAYPKIQEIADIDVAGVIHMKWDNMMSFAKTFCYRSWAEYGVPSYQDSYSASADPGSGIIDLVPLNVDNYLGSLKGIEKASDSSFYEYILLVDLCSKEAPLVIHHYKVYLASWEWAAKRYEKEKDSFHYFPYMVSFIRYVNTDEIEN